MENRDTFKETQTKTKIKYIQHIFSPEISHGANNRFE